MKRTLYVLSVLAFLLVFAPEAFAQGGVPTTIDISANVLQHITASTVDNVNFGDIDPELNPTPSLDVDALSASGLSGTSQFGTIDLSGATGSSVTISWNGGSDVLTLTDGAGTSSMNYNIAIAYTDENTGSQTAGGTTIVANSGDTITLSDGQGTVVVGGTLDTPNPASGSSLPAGSYSATLNVTFDYSL